jgi:hypothetical protein
MLPFFIWIEESALSIWVSESFIGFPLSLSLHALGMAFLVGVQFLVALRILGVADKVSPVLLHRFYPLMWGSFFVVLISGLLLLAAYPAKGLTNPVFYLKMLIVACGLVLASVIAKQALATDVVVFNRKHKLLAILIMLLWVLVITLGRLLAYTYKVLLSIELGA